MGSSSRVALSVFVAFIALCGSRTLFAKKPRQVYVACVDCYSSASLYPRAAQSLFVDEVEVKWVAVRTKKQFTPGQEAFFQANRHFYEDRVFYIDPSQPETIEIACRGMKELGIIKIIGGMDEGNYHSPPMSEYCSLPDNRTETAYLRRMKAPQAHAVGPEYGISSLLSSDISEILAFVHEQAAAGYREVIIKPNDGGGSIDVLAVPVDRTNEIIEIVRDMRSRTTENGSPMDRVVIQPKIEGVEYFVDTYTADGVTKITGLWKYYKVVEDGRNISFVNRPLDLDSTEAIELQPIIEHVIEKVDHRIGPAHIEMMKETASGRWKLIEHNGRVAGSGIPDIERRVWGISNLELALLHAVDPERFRKEFESFPRKRLLDAALLRVSSPLPGRIRAGRYDQIKKLNTFVLPAPHYAPNLAKEVKKTMDLETVVFGVNFVGETQNVRDDLAKAVRIATAGGLLKHAYSPWRRSPGLRCRELMAKAKHTRALLNRLKEITWP